MTLHNFDQLFLVECLALLAIVNAFAWAVTDYHIRVKKYERDVTERYKQLKGDSSSPPRDARGRFRAKLTSSSRLKPGDFQE
jgi:hypothetical protein